MGLSSRTTSFAYLCVPAGLAPELVFFDAKDDMQAGTTGNQLRPEVLESIFYMWRFTGDSMYQQWAWRIFQAFEKYSKVEGGYAGLEVIWLQILSFACSTGATALDVHTVLRRCPELLPHAVASCEDVTAAT